MRKISAGDIPACKRLWKQVFQDETAVIDAFFRELFDEKMSLAAEIDGEIAAMVFAYAHEGVVIAGREYPFACIYAGATAPACRGQHLTMDLIRALIGQVRSEMASRTGRAEKDVVIGITPADDGLRDYYTTRFDFMEGFCAMQLSKEVLRGQSFRKITSRHYDALREELLSGVCHLHLTPAQYAYLEADLIPNGGGMYESNEGIAILRNIGEATEVVEYLAKDGDPFVRGGAELIPGMLFDALPGVREEILAEPVRYAGVLLD